PDVDVPADLLEESCLVRGVAETRRETVRPPVPAVVEVRQHLLDALDVRSGDGGFEASPPRVRRERFPYATESDPAPCRLELQRCESGDVGRYVFCGGDAETTSHVLHEIQQLCIAQDPGV